MFSDFLSDIFTLFETSWLMKAGFYCFQNFFVTKQVWLLSKTVLRYLNISFIYVKSAVVF